MSIRKIDGVVLDADTLDGIDLADLPWREIGDTLLTESAASVEFASIPAGYAVFMLIWHDVYGDQAGAQILRLTFNSDSGNNYDKTEALFGVAGTTTHAAAFIALGMFGDTGTTQSHADGHILIRNSATHEKVMEGIRTVIPKAGGTAEDIVEYHVANKWRNVADEIDTVTLVPDAGNFVAGSRFILLGVKT